MQVSSLNWIVIETSLMEEPKLFSPTPMNWTWLLWNFSPSLASASLVLNWPVIRCHKVLWLFPWFHFFPWSWPWLFLKLLGVLIHLFVVIAIRHWFGRNDSFYAAGSRCLICHCFPFFSTTLNCAAHRSMGMGTLCSLNELKYSDFSQLICCFI